MKFAINKFRSGEGCSFFIGSCDFGMEERKRFLCTPPSGMWISCWDFERDDFESWFEVVVFGDVDNLGISLGIGSWRLD